MQNAKSKVQNAKCKMENTSSPASVGSFPRGGSLSKSGAKSVAFCGENLNERVAQSKYNRIKRKNNVSLPRKSAKQKITCHPERSTANKGKHLPNGYSRGAQSKFCEMKPSGMEQNRGAERRWDLVWSLNSFPYANVTFSIKGYW